MCHVLFICDTLGWPALPLRPGNAYVNEAAWAQLRVECVLCCKARLMLGTSFARWSEGLMLHCSEACHPSHLSEVGVNASFLIWLPFTRTLYRYK